MQVNIRLILAALHACRAAYLHWRILAETTLREFAKQVTNLLVVMVLLVRYALPAQLRAQATILLALHVLALPEPTKATLLPRGRHLVLLVMLMLPVARPPPRALAKMDTSLLEATAKYVVHVSPAIGMLAAMNLASRF